MEADAIPPSSPPPHASTSRLDDSPFFESHSRAYSMKSSSPPPLFSSDDSQESVDISNYQSPRIFKNKRKGAWWDGNESAQYTPEPKKTKMTRNFDSGVYMMSDATDSSEDPLPQHKSPFPLGLDDSESPVLDPRTAAFNERIRLGLDNNHETYDFQGLGLEDENIKDVGRIASVIKAVPDPGDQLPEEGQFRSMEPEIYVDFTKNHLHRLTPKIFDIQYLTTLNLRSNAIVELPQEVARLRNLRILNVSLNKLESLPFELLSLFEPYGSLIRLHTMGNPLLEPMSSARFANDARVDPLHALVLARDDLPIDYQRDEASYHLPNLYRDLATSPDRERDVWRIRYFESWENSFRAGNDTHEDVEGEDMGFYEHHPSLRLRDVSHRVPRFIARTSVSYFDQAGCLIENSPALPTAGQPYSVIVETNHGAYGVPFSWFKPWSRPTVPSLVTMSLQSALRSRHFDDRSIEYIRNLLTNPTEAIPRSIDAVFTQAIANDTGGWGEFRKCHVCKKDLIVSRAQWVEFWAVGPSTIVPLKVKVCSWGCVPVKVANRPEKELVW